MAVNIVDKSAMALSFEGNRDYRLSLMRHLWIAALLAATPIFAQTPPEQARPAEQTKPAPQKPEPAPPPKETPPPVAAVPKDRPLTTLPYTPSLDVASMSLTANPCADFHKYVCGGGMKNHPMPP